jgi:hypothetical protein
VNAAPDITAKSFEELQQLVVKLLDRRNSSGWLLSIARRLRG